MCLFFWGGEPESTPPSSTTVETLSADLGLTIFLVADGQTKVATPTGVDSIADLFEQAGITLNDGDLLSIDPNQELSGGLVVEVLRHATATIVVSSESADVTHTVSLVGATVGDALQAVGINPADVISVNYESDTLLVDGMTIEVSSSAEPAVETNEDDDNGSSDSSGSSGSSGGGYSGWQSSGSSGSSGGSSSSGSSDGSSCSSDDSTPAASGPTVVSTERYDDCDGSGHGVMVITYSDGTQEERAY